MMWRMCVFTCLETKAEALGNFLITETVGNETQDLCFSRRQGDVGFGFNWLG